MPTYYQSLNADVSSFANKVLLPNGLLTGLLALYIFDRGITGSAINLAPGGTQGASIIGAPTINSNGSMTLSSNGYLQTPILQPTAELTILQGASSQAPLDGTTSMLFSCLGVDTNRGGAPAINAGIQARCATASTAPDGKLSLDTTFGNNGDNPPVQVGLSSPLDIPQWRTPSFLYANAGTSIERSQLGSQTLGTVQQSTLQTKPLYPQTTLTFRVGMGNSTVPLGSVDCEFFAVYSPILTPTMRTNFRTWFNTFWLGKHGYTL